MYNRDEPGFWTKTSFIQLGYGIWVNFSAMAIGLAVGFPAVQMPQLTSPASEILVTVEDTSWIASVMTLFCPVGCMISGLMMDKFGRSIMIMTCHVPMFVGWIYTGSSRGAKNIIIGRAITGIGCGMAMGPPRLYTSEITLPMMRGLLGAFPNLFVYLGIASQAVLGSFLDWNRLCYICCGHNLILFLSYLFLHETPYYLLLKDTTEHATKALSCFRAKNYHVDAELNNMIKFKQDNNIRSLSFTEKVKTIFSGASCKPFAIIMIYIILGNLSGVSILTYWTVEVLSLANSSFDVYGGNVLIAVTRLIFGIVTSILLFRLHRRTLALTSATGLSLSSLFTGLYLHVNHEPSLLPLILFMLYTAFACLGFTVLPFLLMSELYPLQVRGTLIGITIAIVNIFIFSSTYCFPYLRDAIGLSNMMFMFGGFAFLAVIFLYIFLPETRGLTLQEIEEHYKKGGSTQISNRHLLSRRQDGHTREEDLNQRSFVEVSSIGSNSTISGGSRRSVSLMIGDKHFMNLTAAENEELKKELAKLLENTKPTQDSEGHSPPVFFDDPDFVSSKRKNKHDGKENHESASSTNTLKNTTTSESKKTDNRELPGPSTSKKSDDIKNASKISKSDRISKEAKMKSEQKYRPGSSKQPDTSEKINNSDEILKREHLSGKPDENVRGKSEKTDQKHKPQENKKDIKEK